MGPELCRYPRRLAHEEEPDAEDQQHGEKRADIAQEAGGAVRFRAGYDHHVLGFQLAQQVVVNDRRIGLEGGSRFDIFAENAVAGDRDLTNAPGIDLPKELRIRHFARSRLRRRGLEHAEQRDQQQRDDRPEREIAKIWVH